MCSYLQYLVQARVFTQSDEDDASRKVVGYTVFTNATSEHAVEVLEKAKHQLTNRVIAERMGVFLIWVKKLWRRYRVE